MENNSYLILFLNSGASGHTQHHTSSKGSKHCCGEISSPLVHPNEAKCQELGINKGCQVLGISEGCSKDKSGEDPAVKTSRCGVEEKALSSLSPERESNNLKSCLAVKSCGAAKGNRYTFFFL